MSIEHLRRGKVRASVQCENLGYTSLVGTDVRLVLEQDCCRIGIDLNASLSEHQDARMNFAAQRLADGGPDRLVSLTISDAWFLTSIEWLQLPAVWHLEIELRDRWPAIDVEPAIHANQLVLLRCGNRDCDSLHDTWPMKPKTVSC
jgi:hypothetical protein